MSAVKNAFDTLLNRYLALDPEFLEKIEPFTGTTIEIHITGLEKRIYILPDDQGLGISLTCDATPDVVIKGRPGAIYKMLRTEDATPLLLSGEIEMTGNMRLARRFNAAFSQLHIDWEEQLASVIGDFAAHTITQRVRSVVKWLGQSTDAVAFSLGDYLQEEVQLVVSENELNVFYSDVDSLRDRVAALEKRIKKLKL